MALTTYRQTCQHEWDNMMVWSSESSKSEEVRRCPNDNCPEYFTRSRLTKKGWFNLAKYTGAAAMFVVATASYFDDTKPGETS